MGVAAEVTDSLAVMYGGRVVEHGPTTEVLGSPRHPYTKGLIRAIPRLSGDIEEAQALPGRPPTLGTIPKQGCVFRERCPMRIAVCDTVDPVPVTRDARTVACHVVGHRRRPGHPEGVRVITASGIVKTYKQRGNMLGARAVPALRGVDFTIPKGGAVTFIGESGCGKTTLGRIVAGLETYDSGEIVIDGTPMSSLKPQHRQPFFRRVQLIHQDPYSALNPTRTIHQTLAAPLALRAKQTGRGQGVDGREGP